MFVEKDTNQIVNSGFIWEEGDKEKVKGSTPRRKGCPANHVLKKGGGLERERRHLPGLGEKVKQRQEEVIRILDTYKIKYELIDISLSLKVLEEMKMKVSTPHSLPPQIFNGDEYCGDFEMFHQAKENKEILKFLKME
ncbi:SH3 domain-binding glutamic acid-rich-like protein 3 [Equus quagga]|uniref:SH3 domain-binding glutamic acid-rich-like protein 3 n=1 Tax=Equus quagga TaxID=89248 RepID=UPI001EE2B1E3|nr:SH3 domain-binding glutamic acid-rich-like protein 3 [Equus quagga]